MPFATCVLHSPGMDICSPAARAGLLPVIDVHLRRLEPRLRAPLLARCQAALALDLLANTALSRRQRIVTMSSCRPAAVMRTGVALCLAWVACLPAQAATQPLNDVVHAAERFVRS